MNTTEAIKAVRNLGVSLNEYDSAALQVLCDFAEDALSAASAEQQPMYASKELQLAQLEAFAGQSGQAHLAQRLDEAVELAAEAIDLMTRFHSHAQPDDTPDMNAVFPALHFRNFVDDHARLMCKLHQFKQNPVDPAFLRLKKAADEVCAVLGCHGQISARDDRVSALMDCLYATDSLKSVYADDEAAPSAPQASQPVSALTDEQISKAIHNVCGFPDLKNGELSLKAELIALLSATSQPSALTDADITMVKEWLDTLAGNQLAGKADYALLEKIRALRQQAPQEPAVCGCCMGSGWMIRDPDIGTDQECFACDGTGEALQEQQAPAVQEERAAFEAWSKREGAVNLRPAHNDECEDGRFPATYYYAPTETAWRAWANKPRTASHPAPAQTAPKCPYNEDSPCWKVWWDGFHGNEVDSNIGRSMLAIYYEGEAAFTKHARTAQTAPVNVPSELPQVPNAIVHAITAYGEARDGGVNSTEKLAQVIKLIREALSAAPSAPIAANSEEAGWISVEDRLPDPDTWLVAVDTDDGVQVHTLELNEKGQWIHEGEPTFCHSYFFSPTHWRTLPSAPIAATAQQSDTAQGGGK